MRRSLLYIIPFNRVAILFVALSNAAENVDIAIIHRRGRVVVPANVELRYFEPQVQVDVVLFAPLECLVILKATPRDNQKFVVHGRHRMPMPLILHLIHFEAIERVRVVVYDLVALGEARRQRVQLNVASAHQKHSFVISLHIGKIVLEGLGNVHFELADRVLRDVKLVQVGAVTLQNVHETLYFAVHIILSDRL